MRKIGCEDIQFIISEKKHPVIKECVQEIRKRIKEIDVSYYDAISAYNLEDAHVLAVIIPETDKTTAYAMSMELFQVIDHFIDRMRQYVTPGAININVSDDNELYTYVTAEDVLFLKDFRHFEDEARITI